MRLVPGSMKDEESTHNCAQVFVVMSCQPRSLQVDIGHQSYILSPGDHFFVPQHTLYQMINHSRTTEANISFVVIKPGTNE